MTAKARTQTLSDDAKAVGRQLGTPGFYLSVHSIAQEAFGKTDNTTKSRVKAGLKEIQKLFGLHYRMDTTEDRHEHTRWAAKSETFAELKRAAGKGG